ncbi:hypothetical protein Purlil1_13719 [Purpureocillium lilacinum]|uniref:Uncharacterized protein n=1 Tax=Purpureocillium lilacinum TaxID=33203 RepID=A0ABR0BDA9_PURLI|nr:hypothetical protein Purlil1_13719 [Purpureocillium lilacinum]
MAKWIMTDAPAFVPKLLSSTVDFDSVAENRVTMITGRGQTVCWKESNVTVLEMDNQGVEHATKLVDMPTGEGILNEGIRLYVTQGKVVEL